MILNRVSLAFNKLAFCLKVSADLATAWRIIRNTKRYTASKTSSQSPSHHPDKARPYSFGLVTAHRKVFLRTFAGDIQIFFDVFWRKIYRLPDDTLLQAKTIVDLGAHIGMATLYFHLNAKHSKIYCVEPDETNFELLTKNLHAEIENQTVIPVHAAIAEKTGRRYLQRSTLGFNTSIADTPTPLTVEGIEITELLAQWKIEEIDILKIDIEGAEGFLFSGDISWLERVRNIIIEIHSDENFMQFQSALHKYSFTIKKLQADYEDVYWARR